MIDGLKRFFKIQSPEQKRVLHAVHVLERSFQSKSPYDDHAFQEMLKTAVSAIKADQDQPRRMLQIQKWPPLDAAAMYMMILARHELTSGEHHIYRGVLSGEGCGYLAVYEHATKRLISGGRLSEEHATLERYELTQEIGNAG